MTHGQRQALRTAPQAQALGPRRRGGQSQGGTGQTLGCPAGQGHRQRSATGSCSTVRPPSTRGHRSPRGHAVTVLHVVTWHSGGKRGCAAQRECRVAVSTGRGLASQAGLGADGVGTARSDKRAADTGHLAECQTWSRGRGPAGAPPARARRVTHSARQAARPPLPRGSCAFGKSGFSRNRTNGVHTQRVTGLSGL